MPRIATGSLEIIAHRCRGFGDVEQSPRAIRTALDKGAHIHLAARLAKNGTWVVILGPENERLVQRLHTTNMARTGTVPLEHALAVVAAHAHGRTLYLEAKDAGNERELLKTIARLGLLDHTILIAWEPNILARAHAIEPRLRLGIALVPIERPLRHPRATVHAHHPRKRVTLAYDHAQRFDALAGFNATPVHAIADKELASLPLFVVLVPAIFASKRIIAQAHERDARLVAWGVHNRFLRRVLVNRGADAILTDHAAELVRS